MTTIEVLKEQVVTLFKQMGDVCKDIKTIKENHLYHIEKDMSEFKTDLKWVKKIQWYTITFAATNLVGILITIIIMLLTNK
jgi:hypothetical protein